jgi:hypothetical protein
MSLNHQFNIPYNFRLFLWALRALNDPELCLGNTHVTGVTKRYDVTSCVHQTTSLPDVLCTQPRLTMEVQKHGLGPSLVHILVALRLLSG